MKKLTIFSTPEKMEEVLPENSVKLLKVGDKRICLARTKDGIFAVDDNCTHAKASLSKGFLNQFGEVICPLHNYRFNLKTGDCSESSCPAVKTYPIQREEGGVFILINT